MTATYASFPSFDVLGVANNVLILSGVAGVNHEFTFRLLSEPIGTIHTAQVADVIARGLLAGANINTAGSTGRLTLTAAKARTLGIYGGTPWVGSSSVRVAGTPAVDFNTASPYYCLVTGVAGSTITLAIQDRPGHFTARVVDWSNPAIVWTGSETRIALTPGATGTVYLHDAFLNQDPSFTAIGKWPDGLGGGVANGKRRSVKLLYWVSVPVAEVTDAKKNKSLLWLPQLGHHLAGDFDPSSTKVQSVDIDQDWLTDFHEQD